MSKVVYKLVPQDLWQEAEKTGVFSGSPIDLEDGFMHFSTSAQVRETAEKYFTGHTTLFLVEVSMSILAEHWKWDVSRGGDLFPHLYVDLPLNKINWVKLLPFDGGVHQFPEMDIQTRIA